MNKVVIIYGPPASGKGTQAKLVAKFFNLIELDTGSYIKRLVYNPENKYDKKIAKQKELVEGGYLAEPSWVLSVVKKLINKIYASGSGVVLSGSPRTMFEAFGDKRRKGLIDMLIDKYGKKNIHIFELSVSEEDSIQRIKTRYVCSLCDTPILGSDKVMKTCPFCGFKLHKRSDDRAEVIQTRFKEYKERTKPILKKLEKNGFKIDYINGRKMPFKVFENIKKHLN